VEKDKHVGTGLWESILKEVATATKLPDATLLMLGRPGIGKRTLVQALLQHAWPSAAAAEAQDSENNGSKQSRSVALDFAYFGVRDPEANDAASAHDFVCQACTSVFILEDIKHEKLLRSRLSADKMKHMAAVICLDLKEPWTMMEDLRKWLDWLRGITSDLLLELTMGEQDELRTRIVNALEKGAEAGSGGDDSGKTGGSVSLTYNLGIPCIVTVCRADGASALETQKTIGWAETIEAYLRSECLSYGAAIVYTMIQTKNMTNVELLYEYLMHRLYGYSFKRQAQVPSRDTLFLPSGWDSREKVDQVASNLQGGGLERSFESVVVPPQTHELDPAPAETCEDMNVFLKRAAGVLHKLGGTSATGSRARAQMSMPQPADPNTAAGAGGGGAQPSMKRNLTLDGLGGARRPSQQPPPGEGAGGAGAPGTDNSSLANFFQNLLTRGQSGAPGGAPGAPGSQPRMSRMGKSLSMGMPKGGAASPASPAAAPAAANAPAAAPAPATAPAPTGGADTKKDPETDV